jgi:hypothetical protein
LQLAEKVVELQELGESNATICERLDVTDQTIRDVLLLAHAPAGLHKLVRERVVSSTLAIEEIRSHGGEKALERLTNAAKQVKANGKAKVTKKALARPAAHKITDPQAKQLLQALQAVLHDPAFGELSPGTIAGVHTALTPIADLLDVPAKHSPGSSDVSGPKGVVFVDELADPIAYPLHAANGHGVFADCEWLRMPKFGKHSSGIPAAEIRLAHPEPGTWIYSVGFHLSKRGLAANLARSDFVATFPSRFKAICAARDDLVAELRKPDVSTDKKASAAVLWLDELVYSERQKLVDYARAQQRMGDLAPLAKQVKRKTTPLHPAAARPFPMAEEGSQNAYTAIEARENAK